MEKGSRIRSSRRHGPDVWEYRWREACSGQTRKHRRIVIRTLDIFKDESAALKAITALRKDININDRRMRTKPLRFAELIEHYRQKELAADNEMEDFIDEAHIRGLPAQVDRAEVGSNQSQRDQGSRGRTVAPHSSTRPSYSRQDSESDERAL